MLRVRGYSHKRYLLYEGAADRIERTEAVSKSSALKDSTPVRANRGTSSVMEEAIVAQPMVPRNDVLGRRWEAQEGCRSKE